MTLMQSMPVFVDTQRSGILCLFPVLYACGTSSIIINCADMMYFLMIKFLYIDFVVNWSFSVVRIADVVTTIRIRRILHFVDSHVGGSSRRKQQPIASIN